MQSPDETDPVTPVVSVEPAENPPAPLGTNPVAVSPPPEDKFRKGKIIKYFPKSGYGFVRDQEGREVYFHIDEVRFVGEKKGRPYIAEGASVGFDVGRTSRGLRVTLLKIY